MIWSMCLREFSIPEMWVSNKALTSYPFWISSRRHSTCPPSAAEWMGSWPERWIAPFVVMGMRALKTLQNWSVCVGGGGELRDKNSKKTNAKKKTGHWEKCSLDCDLSYSVIRRWNWKTVINRRLFVEMTTVKTLQSCEVQGQTCFSPQCH